MITFPIFHSITSTVMNWLNAIDITIDYVIYQGYTILCEIKQRH